jgi:hypothetical protein
MRKITTLVLFGLGASAFAFGSVPEIDPGSSASALALLAGAIMMVRGHKAKR